MPYVIQCLDKPDSAALRQATRAQHLAYIETVADRVVAAGPLLAADGATPLGSLLIIDFADQEQAQAFAAADPYNLAGLFASVAIWPWRQVYPKG